MAGINLTTSNLREEESSGFAKGANFGIFVFLLVTLIAWGALYAVNNYYLQKSIDETKREYESKIENLKTEESKMVIDFQKRLDASQALLKQGRGAREDLEQVQSLMVSDVYLSSYSFDDQAGKISLVAVANNFNTVAKQILSFKSSTYFESVIAGTTTLDSQTNKVSFPVELRVKAK